MNYINLTGHSIALYMDGQLVRKPDGRLIANDHPEVTLPWYSAELEFQETREGGEIINFLERFLEVDYYKVSVLLRKKECDSYQTEDLPQYDHDKRYIASERDVKMVAASGRTVKDFLIPNEPVHNEDGEVVGYKSFKKLGFEW